MACDGPTNTSEIKWIDEPKHITLIKTPTELKYELAYKTAKKVDLIKLDNSLNRIVKNKDSIYTQAELNDITVKLGGAVRGNKEKIIGFIRQKVIELTT